MRLVVSAICLLTSAVHAAWVIEDIPTATQFMGTTHLIGKEMASAYRPIYNAHGAKTGEYIAIAYRSKYLYVTQRQGTGWNSLRFDDNGRYPSIALDGAGNPHMSYFRTSNQKLYYAHPMPAGTGTCGPNLTWACEEIPATIYGAPIGRSAITVQNTKIHLLFETPSNHAWYPSMILRLSKTIGAPGWDPPLDQVTISKDLSRLAIRVDGSGMPQVLINSEYLDWYRRTSTGWGGIGPLNGTGSFDISSSDAPRVCYRDFATNTLTYARSNGTDYWTETVIDWNIGPYGSCSIAIPPPSTLLSRTNYSPRIAYYDDSDDSIKFATQPLLVSQPWSVQTVTTATGVRILDLHLDKQARPSIIYFDSAVLKLRLAKSQ